VVLSPARAALTGPVVVTGADGFAGRAVCAHLRAAGIPFRGLVRALSPFTAARPDMLPVGDLVTVSPATLTNVLRDAHAVVHLAGRVHAMRDDAADPVSEFRAANVAATERLARAAAAAGVAHFVFASSVKVNGESAPPERAFRESDPPDPRDAYAISKWEAECMLGDVSRSTSMPVTVLRLPLMYGPRAKANVARLTEAIASGMPLPLARIDNRRSLQGTVCSQQAGDERGENRTHDIQCAQLAQIAPNGAYLCDYHFHRCWECGHCSAVLTCEEDEYCSAVCAQAYAEAEAAAEQELEE